jgi:hypothetical protein
LKRTKGSRGEGEQRDVSTACFSRGGQVAKGQKSKIKTPQANRKSISILIESEFSRLKSELVSRYSNQTTRLRLQMIHAMPTIVLKMLGKVFGLR